MKFKTIEDSQTKTFFNPAPEPLQEVNSQDRAKSAFVKRKRSEILGKRNETQGG